MRRLLVVAALAASALVAPGAAATAHASAPVQAVSAAPSSSAACTYRRVGNHWNCITPGAYCPKAAHGKAGYAKATKRKYRCSLYDNGQWRWKRV